MSSASNGTPSTKNWTPATPTLSEALALTRMIPLTVLLSVGAVMETAGGVVSGAGGGGDVGSSCAMRKASTLKYSRAELSLSTCWPALRLMPLFPPHWNVSHPPVFGTVINPVLSTSSIETWN